MRLNERDIWETLSKVDVSEHIEKKGNLSYLSWAWAWGELMGHFPQARYRFDETEHHADGSATVHCMVAIEEHNRTMWLPVMDYKNKAIQNPSARDISDAKMRCLVKCIAMFGLGHYIYAGEDLPEKRDLGPAGVGADLNDEIPDHPPQKRTNAAQLKKAGVWEEIQERLGRFAFADDMPYFQEYKAELRKRAADEGWPKTFTEPLAEDLRQKEAALNAQIQLQSEAAQ